MRKSKNVTNYDNGGYFAARRNARRNASHRLAAYDNRLLCRAIVAAAEIRPESLAAENGDPSDLAIFLLALLRAPLSRHVSASDQKA
jgi:hypothetical protein